MNRKKMVKDARVVLLIAIMITSTISLANAGKVTQLIGNEINRDDTTPPVTLCNLSGEYLHGIYIGNVTVTLTATDNESGVNITKYQLDNGSWLTYHAPFNVTTDGFHTLLFYSVDNAGNAEPQRNVSFIIRRQPGIAFQPLSLGFLTVYVVYSANFTNIPWKVTVEGASLWYPKKNGSYQGTIKSVGPYNSSVIRSGFLLGLGPFNATVQVDVFPPIKVKGYIFLFFMIVKPIL